MIVILTVHNDNLQAASIRVDEINMKYRNMKHKIQLQVITTGKKLNC